MNVKVKARKILEPMANYHSFEGVSSWPSWCDGLFSNGEEEPLGFYENEESSRVLVTTNGIHVVNEKNHSFAKYVEIDKAELPGCNKQNADFVMLKLINGRSMLVPIRHGNGRFRDVYEFVRFIDRVTSFSRL